MVCEQVRLTWIEHYWRCLNPCFNGRWSASVSKGASYVSENAVLILVLMEDGLRELNNKIMSLLKKVVLILVLMEDGLRVK